MEEAPQLNDRDCFRDGFREKTAFRNNQNIDFKKISLKKYIVSCTFSVA